VACRPAKEKRTTQPTLHPALPQELPADQRAPQREERLVDVGPPVIPHAQAAKLIEPGKRALDDPPPPASHSHARCGAWPVRARCDGSGDRAEWRPPTPWPSWGNRQERFEKISRRIWKQRGGHACSRYLADEDQVSEALLLALSERGAAMRAKLLEGITKAYGATAGERSPSSNNGPNARAGAQLNLLEWQRRRGDEKEAVLSPRAAPPLSRATGDCSRYRYGNSPIGSAACSAVSHRGNEGRTARLCVVIP
jgi:hypothetical protein